MWPNPQFPADLVTFTEEILNVKLHFLCSVGRCTILENLDQDTQATIYDIIFDFLVVIVSGAL